MKNRRFCMSRTSTRPKKYHMKCEWIPFFLNCIWDKTIKPEERWPRCDFLTVITNQRLVVGPIFLYSLISSLFFSCSYKSIGRFCGTKRPSDVISPDSCLKMVFHSDSAVSGRGFKARLILTARPQNLAPTHNYRLELDA